MDITAMALGAGAVGVVWFAYLCITKGIPAAWSYVKSKLGSVEATIVADVQKDIATIKADLTAIKAKVGL